MIPYRDDNPTATTPVVTHALIAINVVVFLLCWANQQQAIWEYGFIPWELIRGRLHPDSTALPGFAELFTSMFMHGSFMHLAGNMLFLWVFGDNVEDAMGHRRFLVFYLATGLLAQAAQLAALCLEAGAPPVYPISAEVVMSGVVTSPVVGWFIPVVGASGAISGVLAAYYLLYPSARVRMLVPIFIIITTMSVPAAFVIGYWFLLQLLSGVMGSSAGGGVAWWAHVGGFVGGLLLTNLFLTPAIRQRLKVRRNWRRVQRHTGR